MTQQMLADLAKVNIKTVANVEQGFGSSIPTKRKILAALEVPEEEWKNVFPSLDAEA